MVYTVHMPYQSLKTWNSGGGKLGRTNENGDLGGGAYGKKFWDYALCTQEIPFLPIR